MTEPCLFCRILRNEVPARLVFENADCIAFRDINPQAPVHVLVIPRQHVASLNLTTDATLIGKLSVAAVEIAKREGVAESGYRIVVNTNSDAGQSVPHLHLHLLGGRPLSWPPG
jgi:histidine triad (HIT) family protein